MEFVSVKVWQRSTLSFFVCLKMSFICPHFLWIVPLLSPCWILGDNDFLFHFGNILCFCSTVVEESALPHSFVGNIFFFLVFKTFFCLGVLQFTIMWGSIKIYFRINCLVLFCGSWVWGFICFINSRKFSAMCLWILSHISLFFLEFLLDICLSSHFIPCVS